MIPTLKEAHPVILFPNISFPRGRMAGTRYPATFCAVRSLLPALLKLPAREYQPKKEDTGVIHAMAVFPSRGAADWKLAEGA